MRIAVDARELCGKPTGVGRYLAELWREWQHHPAARRHEWRLYAHEQPRLPEGTTGSVTVLAGHGGTLWEQWTLARRLAADRPDVLFAPAYTAPLTAPCPVVLTVHDLSFTARPEWFSAREGVRRRRLTAWSARRARLVLTPSRFSAAEVERLVGVPASRIRAIPHGMRAATGPERAREPLVLYVGSIFERRHVDRLVRAFIDEVATALPTARLAIVGENRARDRHQLERMVHAAPPDIASRIALRSYVPDAELTTLYATASAFVFLSEYEGFGLTPLEALAAGVPPVVLDTSVARETYGQAARYLPLTADLELQLGAALIDLLTDEGSRRLQLQAAPSLLARYRWSHAAEETWHALEEAAGA